MRTLTAILLLAGLAMAIPLRKGASLGYKVWRGWESDSTFATLTVLDSTATDSGTLWRVGIRDSLIGSKRIRLDTATLWVQGDTDTVWLAPSCLAAWDPAPRRIASDNASRNTLPLAYGELAGACFPEGWGTPVSIDSSGWKVMTIPMYTLSGNLRTFSAGLSVSWFSTPQSVWLSDTGWGRLEDTVSREGWTLVSVDGRSRAPQRGWDTTATLLTRMVPGESWIWEVTSYSTIGSFIPTPIPTQLVWTVSDTAADSSGWIRRTIRSDSTIDLRFQLATGKVLVSGKDSTSMLIARGMFRLWSDLRTDENLWERSEYGGWADAMGESTGGAVDSLILFGREGVGLDQLVQGSYHNDILSILDRRTSSLQVSLLVHDSDTIRTASLSTPRVQALTTSLTSLSSLCSELSSHPTSLVRITNLSGRSHSYPASEAMVALPSLHGVVFVEVREGTSELRGRLFLP